MIKDASEYRSLALESLKDKWTDAVVLTLVYVVVSCATSIGYALTLLLLPMGVGFANTFLSNARGNTDFSLPRLFDYFKDYARVLLTELLVVLYTLLWSMLLIIPGIIKSFSYAMVPFVLRDDPGIKYDAAITLSSNMMRGHKFDLFYLYLTFIGWFLLSILTCGFGFLWLYPYVNQAKAFFYEDVKADYEAQALADQTIG